ncbi:MAG: fatty acid desaturase [Nannocystaceae bacterium]
MDEVLQHSVRVPKEALRGLMPKSDGPGLARFLATFTLFVGSAVAAASLGAAGSPAVALPIVTGAVAYLGFFPALHESGHGTAFRTPILNRAVCWFTAAMMLEGPTFFREFHWEHHRKTQDRAHDPEIMTAPEILDGWPTNPFVYLGLASGQALWVGKFFFTVGCALLPQALWRRLFPFVRASMASRVAWECRAVLALLVALVAGGLAWIPGFWAVLLIWPAGHVLLGLYLMAEHTGLANEGSQLHRTRTLETTAWVRWWMWNMPYHGEHHGYPAVPFHALPRLHRLLGDELENLSPGYLAFHREALARSLGLHRRP